MQCLDSLVQKIQGGVVIQFEKIGPDPTPIADNNNGKINGIDQDQSTKGENNQCSKVTLLYEINLNTGQPLTLSQLFRNGIVW